MLPPALNWRGSSTSGPCRRIRHGTNCRIPRTAALAMGVRKEALRFINLKLFLGF